MISIIRIISPIELLFNTILAKYLSKSYCLNMVSEKQFNFNIPMSFVNIGTSDNNKNNLVRTLLKTSELGCSDYIVRMKNPQLFMTAFEKANRLGIVRSSDRKIIFLPFPNASYTRQAYEMLSMSECNAVANVLVILPDDAAECESFTFITHKFVGSESEITQPLFLDRWSSCTQRFDQNNNLFPHDMTNMKGKALRVSCFTYKPYVLLDLDTRMAPHGRDGIDIRILEEMCRQINCSIVINKEDKDLWGELYDTNQTGMGIIGSVAKNKADMGITGLYAWFEVWMEMDISFSYMNVAITCLVPAPRILQTWEIPLLPFSKLTWLAVLITFTIGGIGLCIARRGSCDKVLLIVFGTMLSQPQYNASNTWRNRSIIGWLLVAGLILVSAYGAGLASTFTVPKYEVSIDTIQDIIDRDMIWGGQHDAWIYSLILSPEPLVKKIVNQFRAYSVEELKRRSFTRSMAFSLERLPRGTFAIPEYITKEAALNMQLLLEDLYYEQSVIIMSKNSPYTRKINQLIGILHQSGLLLAWESQVTLKYMDYNVQIAAKLSRMKDDVTVSEPFSIKKIQGVFILYFIGVNAAFILFLCEIFYFSLKHGKWCR